jgi:hypothetical protein
MHEIHPSKSEESRLSRLQQADTTQIRVLYAGQKDDHVCLPPLSHSVLKCVAIQDQNILQARGIAHLNK